MCLFVCLLVCLCIFEYFECGSLTGFIQTLQLRRSQDLGKQQHLHNLAHQQRPGLHRFALVDVFVVVEIVVEITIVVFVVVVFLFFRLNLT